MTAQRQTLAPQPSPALTFDALTLLGRKREKRLIRALCPDLEARGLRPHTLRDADLRALCQARQAARLGANSPERDQGEPAHWRINGFIRALARLSANHELGLPALNLIAGPRVESQRTTNWFKNRFGGEIDQIQSERGQNAKAKAAEIHGLLTCYRALGEAGEEAETLAAMLAPSAFQIIKKALRHRRRDGAFVQAMRALAAVAVAYDDEAAYDDINEAAGDRVPPRQVSAKTMTRLSAFHVLANFAAYARALADAATIRSPADLKRKTQLFRVQSALFALIAIFATSTFELVGKAVFDPRPSLTGARPHLVLPATMEDIERHLPKRVVALIDIYYAALRRLGVKPVGLFANPDGSPRTTDTARASLETLLASLRFPLSPLELRDLSVAQMAWRGERFAKMARAARMSRGAFYDRYEKLIRNINNLRRKGPRP